MKPFFDPISILFFFYSCNTYVSMPPTTGGFNNSSKFVFNIQYGTSNITLADDQKDEKFF